MARDVVQAVRDLILQDTVLANMLGNRIYTMQMPQTIKTYPAIVLWLISEEPWDALDAPVQIETATIQVNVYGKDMPEATEVRLKVRDHINHFSGLVSGVDVRSITQSSGGTQLADRPEAGTDEYRFYVRQDYHVTYCSQGDI